MALLERYLDKTSQNKKDSATIAYLAALDHLSERFPEIGASIIQELHDQRSHVKLIASENYSSLSVQLAMGNLLTDKYAEGYPHHRFYSGCENVDSIEERAVEELKALFGCEHAYVQPHSGADANLVAFWAILLTRVQNPEVEKLGKKNLDALTEAEYEQIRQLLVNQKVMGMSLNAGGHLTHGYRHNISSKFMKAVYYDVDPDTELLDYDALARQVKEERPLILLAGYSAHPRRLDFARFREIADSVGAVLMVDMAHFAGLVAGKVFTDAYNPIPYADIVTSTTHKTLRGPRGGIILCKEEFKEMVDKGCPLALGGPLPHVMAAKAIAFQEAHTPQFQDYAQSVVTNAQALAEALLQKNVRLVTGGTENHMVILDISSFGLTGRHAEKAFHTAGFAVNRNAIPYDQNGPWYTSGVRIGTPAITTLGMGKQEMQEIAAILVDILSHTTPNTVERTGQPSKANCTTDPEVLVKSQQRVTDLLGQYPLYPEILTSA